MVRPSVRVRHHAAEDPQRWRYSQPHFLNAICCRAAEASPQVHVSSEAEETTLASMHQAWCSIVQVKHFSARAGYHRQQVVVGLVDELHMALQQRANALAHRPGALWAVDRKAQALFQGALLPLRPAQQRPIQLLHLRLQLLRSCTALPPLPRRLRTARQACILPTFAAEMQSRCTRTDAQSG